MSFHLNVVKMTDIKNERRITSFRFQHTPEVNKVEQGH